MHLNKDELKLLKDEGYMQQQDKEYFSLRVLTSAGILTSNQLRCLADIADKYGRGEVGSTTRQSIEIPWLKEEAISEVKEKIKEAGITTGGTGFRVVGIAACKGKLCKYGLVNSQQIGKKFEEKFLGMELPGKFKIGITACPNNCVKAPISDLGFMAQNEPTVEKDACKGCRICERTCKVKAIEIVDKKAVINYDKCISCGQCIKACPFKAMKLEKEGMAAYIGGKFGRTLKMGERMTGLYQPEELEKIAEKVIAYYKENGSNGERLGDTINRLGYEHIKTALEL